jgi:8-oxo-dGTP pyrophosphatase MutT (NUDIX family)
MTAPAHPAATVVLLRDVADSCEVLLVRRNTRLDFHGGAWVFPGGRIDAADYRIGGDDDIVSAARHAAVREALEEAGLAIAADDLVPFARWITPELSPKRFDTWFFVAPGGQGAVRVDGSEIHEHRWFAPAEATAAQRRGEIELPPPTFVTLQRLSQFRSTAETLATLASAPLESLLPRVCLIPGGACSLYPGDAGYDTGDPELAGPRHRLWLMGEEWRYERDLPNGRVTCP